ncbi:MAG: glycoside hydrolase family 2 protein [Treponema sp.]|nr:glycoside hydrolase family 2 protein [Treponema sp.]
MVIQKLHDNWKMRKCPGGAFLPAKVPGSVYHDLLLSKRMEDPFWRDNEDKAFLLMENNFEYTTEFVVSENLLSMDQVLLRFDGLDTIAEITLNNNSIARTDNMHRTWEFEVSDILKKDKNSLTVMFHQKTCCMSGRDMGSRLPDAGIWRDVSLLGFRMARIDSVYITQKHEKNTVNLDISVEIESTVNSQNTEYPWKLTITDPQGKIIEFDESSKQICIENAELWWPNGYGAQPLYIVSLILYCPDGTELDRWERRIGLKTITFRRNKDEWGECFETVVNGVAIFGMGANYIPEDAILGRITPKRTRSLLEQCVEANFNTVRVWGGGYYPDDCFYDTCDELGLIVWQDFMFCGTLHELTDAFEHNIRAELADNIKRIRHHACLGMWCGNNELELTAERLPEELESSAFRQRADYIKMFEYILPQILKELDPQTCYWPSSPSSGGSFHTPNDPDRGDSHFWDVLPDNKPFAETRKYFFRYLSEFGFQSFPALKTIESFTLPEDRNIFSYVMERQQRNNADSGKIMSCIHQMFLYPNDFDTLLYASQLFQAEAVKFGAEHLRRNRGRCMGAIYRQFNDCRPAASCSSIDYCSRRKALYYFAKRFFQPLMISCREEGKSFSLCVANETFNEKKLTVRWEIRDKNAKVKKGKSVSVKVPALSSLWLDTVEVPEINVNEHYLSYFLRDGNTVISEGTALFTQPKYFHWEDPKLSYTIDGYAITVKAASYAKNVEIQNSSQDLVLSDNYFDMNGGEKTVRIVSGEEENLRLRSVWDIK